MGRERTMFGRRVIRTDVENITPGNVYNVLQAALSVHLKNREEIEYLYNYYCGDQPILTREKSFRKEICNKIVENCANEIVSFKVGYQFASPLQYINVGEDSDAEQIDTLNRYMFTGDKEAKDIALATWFTICGTAYRIALPDKNADEDEGPFEFYTLDPRNTFVVYYSGLGEAPVMGVRYVVQQNGSVIYTVYTRTHIYTITMPGSAVPTLPQLPDLFPEGATVKVEPHYFGDVPIVEYPANEARLGAFEIVLPLLDGINKVVSNRLDGVEQFIDALLVIKGVQMEDGGFQKMKELGGLELPAEGDAYYLVNELNQTQTQTLVNDMYQRVLVICGMPNRNGGSSTSDTGAGVVLRDGWSDAETRAKNSEPIFKSAEKRFLRLVIRYCNIYRDTKMKLSAFDITFPRRNYENIQTKAQVLLSMLGSDMIAPELAFQHCAMFADPDLACKKSMEYYAKRVKEQEEELRKFAEAETVKARSQAGQPEPEGKTE